MGKLAYSAKSLFANYIIVLFVRSLELQLMIEFYKGCFSECSCKQPFHAQS